MVSLPPSPPCYYQVSSPAFPRLAHPVQPAARGGDRSPALGHCAPILTLPGQVNSFAHETSRLHSPDCWVGGMLALWGWVMSPSVMPSGSSLVPLPSGLHQLQCAAQVRAGPPLLSAVAGEGQYQLSHSQECVRASSPRCHR